jgi:hypothetical protein
MLVQAAARLVKLPRRLWEKIRVALECVQKLARRAGAGSRWPDSPSISMGAPMTAAPDWPAYPIGPKDSIFAMGLAGIKFAELESVLRFIFGTVYALDADASTMMGAKIGNDAMIDLTRRRLSEGGWADPAKGDVAHFIKAFDICLENRNYLMHSQLAWTGSESTVLFRTSKQGKTLGAVPTLLELRAVADDMHAYCEFGRALGNAINNRLSDPPMFPVSAFPWPDKPALPRALRYS